VFDTIGDVGLFALDARIFEGRVKQTAGWTNKGFA
jgi:hypothetical protein